MAPASKEASKKDGKKGDAKAKDAKTDDDKKTTNFYRDHLYQQVNGQYSRRGLGDDSRRGPASGRSSNRAEAAPVTARLPNGISS